MRRSSRRDFAVYEFKEEDEAVESASGRFTPRSGKRGNRAEDRAISRITFLKAFAEDMFSHHTSIAGDLTEETSLAPDYVVEGSTRLEAFSPGTPNSDDGQSNCSLSNEQSDETQPSAGSSPDDAENDRSFQYPVSSDCWNGVSSVRETDDADLPVIVLAEYVICGTKLFTESRLTFFTDSIRIHCSDTSGKELVSEWRLADVEHINCQWSQSAGTTWVKIWLKSNSSSNEVMDACNSSVLKFCVPDFDWLEKERKIMILGPGYKTIWSAATDVKLSDEEEEVRGLQSNISRHYLPDFMEACDEVIYPKGDPDAVSISKRDVDLLQPETFINDTIIDFYIKYLMNKIEAEERHRFHFFNSFFFRKLVDLDKDQLSTAEGRAAFLRVRKWTRKVNIFEKDYLFIPVNYNLHWSLLVICHPGEVARLKENPIHEACRVPCILHMDSMKGNHDGLKKLIQSYLWEEWKERNEESTGSLSSLRFIPLELPQQQNAFDCGFFLLHYVELFLKEAPANFNPFTITKFSSFLNADWFIPDEASHKRFVVRNMIYELLRESNENKDEEENQSSPASCSHPPEEREREEENDGDPKEEGETAEMLSPSGAEEGPSMEAPDSGEGLAGCVVADSLDSDDDGGEVEDAGESGGDGARRHPNKRRKVLCQDDGT